MKLDMTIDEALAFADEWSRGLTLYPAARGWRVVCMLLAEEVRRLRADGARLDWLADPANTVGNVQLPAEAVTANLHSLRDAIDAAMAMPANEQGQGRADSAAGRPSPAPDC